MQNAAFLKQQLAAFDQTAIAGEPPPPELADVVNWHSPIFGSTDGYGSSAEHLICALIERGYDVRIQPGFIMTSSHSKISEMLFAAPAFFEHGTVRIAYAPPLAHAWRRADPLQAALGFSMWEDTALPRSFDAAFREVDAIATPSRFCQQLFQARIDELGLGLPVYLVPLGVDVDDVPVVRRARRPDEPFVVIHSATRSSELRKGADVALAAFQQAFRQGEYVRLILRSRVDEFFGAAKKDPRVLCKSGPISDGERAAHFLEAHVLLYPSRGEGFGLIPLEALATGLPAICSAGSGMLDYRELYWAIKTTPAPSQISVSWRPRPEGTWHEPDVDSAARQLRTVYEHYEHAADEAVRAAAIIREHWTYRQSATALAAAIETTRRK